MTVTACNYDSALHQLKGAGLIVSVIETGRMVRCKVDGEREKRGWYCLHEIQGNDNEWLLVGSFGVWYGSDNNAQKIKVNSKRLSDEQKTALKIRISENKRQAEHERQIAADRAARVAAKCWSKHASESGTCAYLETKCVPGYGLRYTPKGNALVPMLDVDGKIHGLQVLYGDADAIKKKGRNKEYWPQGVAKQGHFHLLGLPNNSLILVAEGYATAASLHAATGLCVAVAFDSGNLLPVCEALKKRYRASKILICADDDHVQKCRACKCLTPVNNPTCMHCGEEHGKQNAGVNSAQAAALAVNGAWIAPVFAEDRGNKKISDFNDLQLIEGTHSVRAQIEACLDALNWRAKTASARNHNPGGAGKAALRSIISVDNCISRYSLVYTAEGGTLFDHQEHMLVSRAAVSDLLPEHGWRDMRRHPDWSEKPAVRLTEVGFDPTEKAGLRCNLWGAWPTVPRSGSCERLLELLSYMCNEEPNGHHVYQWVLCWLAYPVQHPGAKMKTALVFHGPQGVGKNLFFESYAAIYGEYARVIDQAAIEDKFNDWASRKLFLIADEVVARLELFHLKNKLKCLITGDWIRINPKNVAAHEERNHVNICFLSNEHQPLVLEKDDRRYAVVHTPPKLPQTLYDEVTAEIESGGIAALHHHLLHLDISDFKPWTPPPDTDAKHALIELSMDNTERFWLDWSAGILGIPVSPAASTDIHRFYRWWCNREGERFQAANNRLSAVIARLSGGKYKCDAIMNSASRSSVRVFLPKDIQPPLDTTRIRWLTACVEEFRDAVDGLER
ncbi:MAG: toprim domain-containing protein [Methylococcaceae bacterium]|nr:MAG: toprim domain-containing protein [Methylococcaceae bacterium]